MNSKIVHFSCLVVFCLLRVGAKAEEDRPKRDPASVVLHASSLFAEMVLKRLQQQNVEKNLQLGANSSELALGSAFVDDFGELIGNRVQRSLKSLFKNDDVRPVDDEEGVNFRVFGNDFDYGRPGVIVRVLECFIKLFHKILNRVLKFFIGNL